MPRARALSVTRSYFEERAARDTAIRVYLCAASRSSKHRALSRIDRRFKPVRARDFSLSSPRASDRYLLIAALPGERPAAESRRVCFLCQRPRIIDTSQFASRKKEKKKKKERGREKERERSFYRSVSRKRRSYNRHGHHDHISRRRGSLAFVNRTHDALWLLVYAYTHVHARWYRTDTRGRAHAHLATSLPNVMLLIWYCRRSWLMVSSRGPSIDQISMTPYYHRAECALMKRASSCDELLGVTIGPNYATRKPEQNSQMRHFRR